MSVSNKIDITALCPYCDRSEEFTDEATARAWLTGHIQHTHDDVLPEYGETSGGDGK